MKISIPIALLLAAGCAEPRSDEITTSAALEAGPARNDEDRRAANDYEREMKAAAAAATPTQYTEDVDWAEASKFTQLDAAKLPPAERAKLDAIRVPVLAFAEDTRLANALLTHNENWYVLAAAHDGVTTTLNGTRNAVTVPGMEIPEAARQAAQNYTLTRTHAVITVSWRAFGLSYSLDVECAKPLADRRCTEDEFALQTVERLGVIGGKP